MQQWATKGMAPAGPAPLDVAPEAGTSHITDKTPIKNTQHMLAVNALPAKSRKAASVSAFRWKAATSVSPTPWAAKQKAPLATRTFPWSKIVYFMVGRTQGNLSRANFNHATLEPLSAIRSSERQSSMTDFLRNKHKFSHMASCSRGLAVGEVASMKSLRPPCAMKSLVREWVSLNLSCGAWLHFAGNLGGPPAKARAPAAGIGG